MARTETLHGGLQSKLDPAKLLGFRNVALVTGADSDLKASSELAFNKRGTETGVA